MTTYHLARAAEPGLVSSIVSAASGKPVGYTRWELDGPAEHTAGSWRVDDDPPIEGLLWAPIPTVSGSGASGDPSGSRPG